ncbi:hypothetical protein DVH24_039665 [Malus domestica]|uniref:Uncharacterized protein n=1 Tax=Malus domestica TaxID=3750 RepID=A0A498I690_MALDO|nr:hypothetical protein DVH24_039665 [Malus domestica]
MFHASIVPRQMATQVLKGSNLVRFASRSLSRFSSLPQSKRALFQVLGIQFEASMLFFATFHGASTLFIWGVSHYTRRDMEVAEHRADITCRGDLSSYWASNLDHITSSNKEKTV